MARTRDIFLVEKAPGAAPVWVEQNDFGQPAHYEQWRVIRRATIAADRPLQHAAAELDIVDAAVADRRAP